MSGIQWTQISTDDVRVGDLIDTPRKGVQAISSISTDGSVVTLWWARSKTVDVVAAEIPAGSLVTIGRR